MRLIDADVAMEHIKQAYEDMGVDAHGVWNKQLAEIFKTADVEDIRMCLHKILGAVSQAPSIEIVRCKDCKYWVSDGGALMICDIHKDPTVPNHYCSYGEEDKDE